MTKTIATQPLKELKALMIVGSNMPIDQRVWEFFKQNKENCFIIGDGVMPMTTDYIERTLQEKGYKVTGKTRIDIDAHGNRALSGHYTDILSSSGRSDTYDLLRDLSKMAGHIPLYVHLWSCYGELDPHEMIPLKKGSIVVTHIEKGEPMSVQLGNASMRASLTRYLDTENKKITPYQQFIIDLQENYEAATSNKKVDDYYAERFATMRTPEQDTMAHVLTEIDKNHSLQEFMNKFFAQECMRFQKNLE